MRPEEDRFGVKDPEGDSDEILWWNSDSVAREPSGLHSVSSLSGVSKGSSSLKSFDFISFEAGSEVRRPVVQGS